ncbi:TIGR03885 family FMN-dependent LLM class oxidoreductase [Microbacterium sp. SD291]|uniref:TIGR03885 family FMN-dependent LLM class oxidoreductase n=1 Tax=Microbacterium sp. SD291 TaxID=2782007 RepID=UPI001A96A93E|nr:TIGR03885 family FMN-dependent LLM class oxidoreductase [Microbacterium sp. SD291]MBO0981248.1 TIGR03885 family FMN-dependent LLM class oxidoreductase [Microbacterium sp. SD291]
MTVIGYHASHEQLPPGMLLTAVRLAEAVGFDAAMCSDHLSPWSRAQGESGFAWSWIGAALARTDFPIGLVTAPGQRYHPVIHAQAMATLEEMFPGRFWAALGSGEALNEHVTGDPWPRKAEREERLRECVDVFRRLFAGEQVDVDGGIRVHEARIWSLPASPPPLLGAAVSPDTAQWVAEWADGLITVGSDPSATGEVLSSFRSAGGRGPAALQVHVSLEETAELALEVAREQWLHSTAPADRMWDLEQPEDFEVLADPTDDRLRQAVIVEPAVDRMAERIGSAAAGYDQVYLHHVGTDQAAFLRRCETELLPMLRSAL